MGKQGQQENPKPRKALFMSEIDALVVLQSHRSNVLAGDGAFPFQGLEVNLNITLFFSMQG
jgi:hypothetical protein